MGVAIKVPYLRIVLKEKDLNEYEGFCDSNISHFGISFC